MGCLIHYAVRDGMLQAVVRGKTLGRGKSAVAAWVAHDIAEQAGRATCNRVLIDVRGIADRLGSLGALAAVGRAAGGESGRVSDYRVAVVDALQNDAYYALHEMAAQARGVALRCFTSVADAARWLRGRD
ncbi:MAG TPA: hypothetical protein VHN19_09175 [Burkholderiales bacterium]|jgi:hypothetical protein|nr:hypothetical protein [Burkholderiales bacterium]